MKKTYLFALAILVIIGCQENEDPQPAEKFAGSWAYESNELSIYFDIVVEDGIHNVINRKVVSPDIPTSEQDNNQIQILFDDDGSCKVIEVVSRGRVFYRIFMLDNDITRDGMTVSEMEITVPGYDPLTLFNQILKKN